jgi:hypothetical protein
VTARDGDLPQADIDAAAEAIRPHLCPGCRGRGKHVDAAIAGLAATAAEHESGGPVPELPPAALAAARRAFPVAAPHALKAALQAAARHIRADERERCAQRAEQCDAVYPVEREDTYGQEYTVGVPFAELLRDES